MANYDGNTIAGSKTGLMRRPVMEVDGSESDVSRTGMFKRGNKGFERGDSDDRREPPAPPTLPEINKDDGGTTGITHVDTEGNDPARRENHPRRR